MDGWLSKTPTSKLRNKLCRVCHKSFLPWRTTQVVCTKTCALALVYLAKEKKLAKDLATGRIELMSLREHLNACQVIFNSWVRERDRLLPCISSGRHHKGQYHAGHYRSVKAAPQLRFNPDNVHKQSASDNTYLSGNIGEYRINLIKKIGIERVEALENSNIGIKYTIDQAIAIGKDYKLKLKQLRKDNENEAL